MGGRRALALPPRPRRRGPGPQPAAAPPPRPARRRPRRPLPRRRSGAGDLRLQRRRPRPARRHRRADAGHRDHRPARPTIAPRRRSSPPAPPCSVQAARHAPACSSRTDGPAVRIVAADDETHEAALVAAVRARARPGRRTRRGRRRARPDEPPAGPPVHGARPPPASPSPTSSCGPGHRWPRRSPRPTRLPSATRLRGWAHDVLETRRRRTTQRRAGSPPRCSTSCASSRSATAPGCAAWLATMRPFAADDGGVELLTFHGAKGREWRTVVVTGVETGSVPHRSATTAAAKAEEVRLLHVAVDAGVGSSRDHLGRAAWWLPAPAEPAARRGRHRRAGRRCRRRPSCVRSSPRSGGGRVDAARRRGARRRREAAMILPDEVCTDADLARHRHRRPGDPDELAAVTGLGIAHRDPAVPRHPRRARRVTRGGQSVEVDDDRGVVARQLCPCGRCGR